MRFRNVLLVVAVAFCAGLVAGVYFNEASWGYGEAHQPPRPTPANSLLARRLIPAGEMEREYLFPEKREWKIKVSEIRSDLRVVLPRGWIARMDVLLDGPTGKLKQFEYTQAPPKSDSVDLWFAPSEKTYFLVTDGVPQDVEIVQRAAAVHGYDLRVVLARPDSPTVIMWENYVHENLEAAPRMGVKRIN